MKSEMCRRFLANLEHSTRSDQEQQREQECAHAQRRHRRIILDQAILDRTQEIAADQPGNILRATAANPHMPAAADANDTNRNACSLGPNNVTHAFNKNKYPTGAPWLRSSGSINTSKGPSPKAKHASPRRMPAGLRVVSLG